jgi:ParB-like chromosome segregation protein Spo0J
MKVKNVPIKDCVPMQEVNRQYYNPYDYNALKRVIRKRGYDKRYAIRAFWNKEEEVYEVFDGIHRLQIARDLGHSTIPVFDESGKLTRQDAITIGIQVNQNRSAYNPMDLANALYELGVSIAKKKRKKGRGRPAKFSSKRVAERMCMSVSDVIEHISLRKLPKDVQSLLGQGKLKYNHGKALAKLVGTKFERDILSIAEKAVKEGMSFRKLSSYIKTLKNKGVYSDKEVCSACNKEFPHDSMNRIVVCTSCATQIEDGHLGNHESKGELSHMKELKEEANEVLEFWNNMEREHDTTLSKLSNEWCESNGYGKKDSRRVLAIAKRLLKTNGRARCRGRKI